MCCRLICIWCLGPEPTTELGLISIPQMEAMFSRRKHCHIATRNGTLELKPWDEDAESMQASRNSPMMDVTH